MSPDSQAKVKAAYGQAMTALDGLRDSDRWQQHLAMQARFHRYSPSNVCLVMLQCPSASRVAGFHAWRGMGRHVKKGEAGIAILAPHFFKVQSEGTDETTRILGGFHVEYVFDVSQTEGEPLPEIAKALEGEEGANLLPILKTVAGVQVLEMPMTGTQHGLARDGQIVIRHGDSPTQQAKTLLHEIAHHRFDHFRTGRADRYPQGLTVESCREIEAESVAYITAGYFGLDTSTYSLDYLASRSKGADVKEISSLATEIQRVACSLIDEIEQAK